MLMTVIGRDSNTSVYGEVAGVRVLITGLSATSGVDLARSFADHRARLVLHTEQSTPETDALVELLADTACEIKSYTGAYEDKGSAVRFAQRAAQAFSGLDAVINLIPLTTAELEENVSLGDVDSLISRKLNLPLQITRVAANRMQLTMTEGLILNVMTMPDPRTAGEAALAGIARSALADMTRHEAEQWSEKGIRINAIGPNTGITEANARRATEPDIAALALYLASKRGRALTGHVFDAAGIAARRC